jgi:hypothetical protein
MGFLTTVLLWSLYSATRGEWNPSKELAGDPAEPMALFGHGGEVATDATKGRRASVATKGPRDVLLHFHHAEILFGTSVGTWDSQIAHEPQDGGGIALEAVEQVLGLGLFDSPSRLGHGGRRRLGSQPSEDELMGGCRELVKHRRRANGLLRSHEPLRPCYGTPADGL